MKAVLLLFPSRGELHAAREKEEEEAPKWEGDSVWWIKQNVNLPSRQRIREEREREKAEIIDP